MAGQPSLFRVAAAGAGAGGGSVDSITDVDAVQDWDALVAIAAASPSGFPTLFRIEGAQASSFPPSTAVTSIDDAPSIDNLTDVDSLTQ